MRIKRALSIATLVATATVWIGATAVTAPAQADQPTPATACWVEKVHSAATAEVICGNPALRPRTDTADIGEVFGPGCGWVALKTEVPTAVAVDQALRLEPAGCN